jgi:hypothetical protein
MQRKSLTPLKIKPMIVRDISMFASPKIKKQKIGVLSRGQSKARSLSQKSRSKSATTFRDDKENTASLLSKKKTKSKSKVKKRIKRSPFDMQKCRKFIIQTFGKQARENEHAEES